jgi:hypothetical protein
MKNLFTNLITGYFELLFACIRKAKENDMAEEHVYIIYMVFLVATIAIFVMVGIIIGEVFDLLSQLFYLPVQIMEIND